VRPVPQLERRLGECEKLGLSEAIVPEGTAAAGMMRLRPADTLRRAIALGLDAGGSPEG
jgi:predicted ATP-dependent serine protease